MNEPRYLITALICCVTDLMPRYTYLGDAATRPELRGMLCDPVRRPDGRCIVGKGKALVEDINGTQHVVLRRLLRLNSKG